MRDTVNARIVRLIGVISIPLLASCIATIAAKAQSQTDGNWTASPTFFATTSKEQRCNAINVWLQSIVSEASRSRRNKEYRRANGQDRKMGSFSPEEIRRFAFPAFRGVFGKSFPELSAGDLKKIVSSLEKCSSEPWVRELLSSPLTLQWEVEAWRADHEKFEKYRREDLARKTPASCDPGKAADQTPGNRAYKAGVLLLETDLYRLYGKKEYPEDCWCSNKYEVTSEAYVSLVFKVDENYRIENDEEYWQRFEKEMLPKIFEQCHPASRIVVLNHVAGFYINDRYYVLRDASSFKEGYFSEPINYAIFSKPIAPSPGTNKDGYERSWADTRISSIAAVREIEAARRKKEDAAEAERLRIARLESKGGVEPTSEELAVAYARYLKIATPTCPTLDDMKPCEWNLGIWIRLKEGKKRSCEPVIPGVNYRCTYSVEFECEVRDPVKNDRPSKNPLVIALYCSSWPKRTVETGILRTPNGWVAYPLDKEKDKK